MTKYQKGFRLEHEVKDWYEKQSYFVSRSAGSHSLFDLIAMNKRCLILIQVKSNGISKKETEQIKNFNNMPIFTKKEVWIKKDRRGWEVMNL